MTNNIWNTTIPISTSIGGTSNVSLTDNALLIGATAGAINSVGPGAAGDVLLGRTNLSPSFITPTASNGIKVTANATTLEYALNGPVTVPYGGTGISTNTAYTVMCTGTTATGNFQNVANVGTAGQVLISNGAAALPSWGNIAVPGSLVLLESYSVAVPGNLIFTDLGAGAYSKHLLVISSYSETNTVSPVTYTAPTLELSTDGGVTWLNTGYISGINYFTSPSSSTWTNQNSTTVGILCPSTIPYNTPYCFSASIWINNLTQPIVPFWRGQFGGQNGVGGYIFGKHISATSINAIRLYNIVGGLTGSGTISLYGLVS